MSLVIGQCHGFTSLSKLTFIGLVPITVFLCFWYYKVRNNIRMGITIFKKNIFGWGEVYCPICGSKLRFTALLTRCCKTKFLTVYPTIYLPR